MSPALAALPVDHGADATPAAIRANRDGGHPLANGPGVGAPESGSLRMPGAAGLVFEAHAGIEGLRASAAAWAALADSLPGGAQFYHRPQWFIAFLENGVSDRGAVWFVTARRAGQLIAVFPLQYQDLRVSGLKPRLLGNVEDNQLQLADFVFAQVPGNERLLIELVHWLRHQKLLKWDALRLRRVPETAAIAYCARAHLPWMSQTLRYDGSSHFDTSQTYDHATRAMSGTFKRNLRRLTRRAEESAALRLQTVDRAAELPEALAHFFDVESSGWKGTGGVASAILCQPALKSFYEALAREFGAIDACVINLLWHGDEVVAGQFCLRQGRVLNVLKVGYRESRQSIAPGNLLLDRVIRQACEDPGLDLVSLVNEPAWARVFKPLSIGVYSYFVPNLSAQGVLALGALLLKRARDRWSALRQARRAAGAAATDKASGEED